MAQKQSALTKQVQPAKAASAVLTNVFHCRAARSHHPYARASVINNWAEGLQRSRSNILVSCGPVCLFSFALGKVPILPSSRSSYTTKTKWKRFSPELKLLKCRENKNWLTDVKRSKRKQERSPLHPPKKIRNHLPQPLLNKRVNKNVRREYTNPVQNAMSYIKWYNYSSNVTEQ